MHKGFALIVIVLVVVIAATGLSVWYYPKRAAVQPAVPGTPPVSSQPLKKENLTLADREAWRNILKWSDECEKPFRDINYGADFSGLTFHKLAPQKYLVEAVCFLGAYQGQSNYFFLDESGPSPHAEPLMFTLYYDYEGTGKPMATTTQDMIGGQFNSSMKQLVILDKFRGIGDCGIYSVYSFNNLYFKPELVELREKSECDEVIIEPMIEPSKWPLIPLPSRQSTTSKMLK